MKIFLKTVYALLALGFFMGLGVLGVVIYISYDLPQINSLGDYSPPIPSRVFSKDGHLLMELSKEKREVATIEEIPNRVINAFLAAEDDNFYNHSGVDYIGIARAMVINIKAGRIVQGASTITQQVAKSLLLSSERTFTRKIKDFILAKKIEEKLTKKEILFLYLNQVYLGGGYYGVKSAFRGYFDKELSEATNAEIALIAGLLVAPSKYSPYNKPERAKSRQKYVLGRMLATEKINEEEYQAALLENIKIQIRKPIPLRAGYFSDWIRQRLITHFGKEEFITNGYEVVTTLDWSLQEKAEAEVLKGVKEIDKRQGYKGPLSRIEGEQAIYEYTLKQRHEIYNSSSNYLIFKPDGTTKREFAPEENEYEVLKAAQNEIYAEYNMRSKSFLVLGNQVEDRIVEFIDLERPVEAVVIKASNTQRMIYADYAGLKIMIPYENFKWAHERKIQVERYYWGYQNHPESIVKPGDVILVQVSKKLESPKKYLHKDFISKYKANKELIEAINKQKFYVGELDQEPEAQGALLSISPETGEILSMVGGSDFSKSQFNRAVQSNRQPGSAFKPLIYAVGLENNHTAASKLLDSPQALGGVDDSLSWKPRNYDGKFKGSMTLRRALETSRNIPTIKLAQDVGVTKITNFVERLKLDVELPADLSVSLGSFGINLLNLVKMYSIFPNGGRVLKIKSIISIKDRYGKVHHIGNDKQDPGAVTGLQEVPVKEVTKKEPSVEEEIVTEVVEEEKVEQNPFLVNLDENQVYDPRLAYLMSNLLRGVVQRGTGRNTREISSYIGGKTGTTNNYVDAWFLGFSAKVVTGVWTGFDNNQTLGFGETGAKSALPIWKSYMEASIKKFGDVDFSIPSGIVNVAIDSKTGELYRDGPDRFMEAFVEGTEPGLEEKISDDDEPVEGRSILDSEDYYSAQ
ncbi:MAG: penicillin-binding protein 1A [Bacteriovoracaceae bacterium]